MTIHLNFYTNAVSYALSHSKPLSIMWLDRFKLSIVVFACLAFISQAFAVVDHRCMGMDGHQGFANNVSATMSAGVDIASMHQHHAMRANASATPDCCKHQQCAMVDCVSIQSVSAAVVATPVPFSVSISDTLAADYAATYLTADIASLFRPPISH